MKKKKKILLNADLPVAVENKKTNKVGLKVHYTHPKTGKIQNGMIKSRHKTDLSIFFVVYECGGNWGHFRNYTGVATSIKDLLPGWVIDTKKPTVEEFKSAWLSSKDIAASYDSEYTYKYKFPLSDNLQKIIDQYELAVKLKKKQLENDKT